MRGGAPRDGAEVRFGVELGDDQLNGDLASLVLGRSEGHRDLHLTVGRYNAWNGKDEKKGKKCCYFDFDMQSQTISN